MKGLGIILVIVGVIWAFVASQMETTVTSESEFVGSIYVPSTTVNNIGLMETRRNHLMFSGLTILVGVVLVGFGSISRQAETHSLRACPNCAELIQPAAKVCRFCNTTLSQEVQDNSTESIDAASASDYELMKHFGITHEGNKYHFGSYRFDTLRRAVAHAQHTRSLQRNV